MWLVANEKIGKWIVVKAIIVKDIRVPNMTLVLRLVLPIGHNLKNCFTAVSFIQQSKFAKVKIPAFQYAVFWILYKTTWRGYGSPTLWPFNFTIFQCFFVTLSFQYPVQFRSPKSTFCDPMVKLLLTALIPIKTGPMGILAPRVRFGFGQSPCSWCWPKEKRTLRKRMSHEQRNLTCA